jgi:hypothetical protein
MNVSNATGDRTMHNDASIFSDLYKDAYGSRPRGETMARFNSMTDQEQQAYMQELADEVAEDIDRERREEQRAEAKFETTISQIAEQFGVDFNTAVRWDMDANNVLPTFRTEVEHYFWSWGLSFDKIDELAQQFVVKEEEAA